MYRCTQVIEDLSKDTVSIFSICPTGITVGEVKMTLLRRGLAGRPMRWEKVTASDSKLLPSIESETKALSAGRVQVSARSLVNADSIERRACGDDVDRASADTRAKYEVSRP